MILILFFLMTSPWTEKLYRGKCHLLGHISITKPSTPYLFLYLFKRYYRILSFPPVFVTSYNLNDQISWFKVWNFLSVDGSHFFIMNALRMYSDPKFPSSHVQVANQNGRNAKAMEKHENQNWRNSGTPWCKICKITT